MSERSENRFRALDMLKQAESLGYERGGALLVIAAAGFELAAALWELQEFFAWAFERSVLYREKK